MIDHFTVKVSDYRTSREFYTRALRPLGYLAVMEFEGMGGFGPKGKPFLWLSQDPDNVRSVHFAFTAPDRKAVDAFYAAALASGARDNGPPGIRRDYHPNYYAAFVLDPDGHNVEAVCHRPVPAKRRPAARRKARRPARKAARRRP
ncbi:MAG TPA: VOC family protein [Anaeromyxobacteraceae bacterium]|nr:VOC family protein [Anaeromyxobacteraceae bacterium]